MTPEGAVKKEIDKLLIQYEPMVWYHKPVQNGMGSPCLDYHCCYRAMYFAIEAKAPDKPLTKRQEITKREIEDAGGVVFVIDNAEGIATLRRWLMESI